MNVQLHPTLARDITLAIIKRTSAGETIRGMTADHVSKWNQDKFLMLIAEHKAATEELARYGIKLATYNIDGAKESTR